MKKLILFFLLITLSALVTNAQNFRAVVMADVEIAKDSAWLDKCKEWGITGINIVVKWNRVAGDNINTLTWTEVDDAIQAIVNKNLDVYIRVGLNYLRPSWIGTVFNTNDYMIKYNGTIFKHPYANPNWTHADVLTPYLLNITSSNAVNKMSTFYTNLIQHLNTFPANQKNKIKLIVPVIGADQESDYTRHTNDGWTNNNPINERNEAAGYSTPEKDAFKNFLSSRYLNDINKLKEKWEYSLYSGYYSFSSFSDIPFENFNWHTIESPLPTIYFPKGKIDWIDFKTEQLKNFYNNLSNITAANSNFKFGLQPSNIYNQQIEYGGFYDFTPIMEKSDFLIYAEDPTYEPNYDFGSDYAKSIGIFWKSFRGLSEEVGYAVETNFFGYNDYSANELSDSWIKQLNSCKNNGGSAIFISHWGTKEYSWLDPVKGTLTGGIAYDFKEGNYDISYKKWKDALVAATQQIIINDNSTTGIHLGLELVMNQRVKDENGNTLSGANYYYHVYNWVKQITQNSLYGYDIYEFPLSYYVRPLPGYYDNSHNHEYRGGGNFITNFMIEKSPNYLKNNFSSFTLTASSYYMPDTVYKLLLSKDLLPSNLYMYNATMRQDEQYYYFTPGLRDERFNKRNPINLIWRSRYTLYTLFPNGSLPDPSYAQQIGWPDSYLNDYIYWLEYYGINQYTGIKIKVGSYYDYDNNIKYTWDNNTNLKTEYPYGHYRSMSLYVYYPTILEWAINAGYSSYPKLAGYNNWPYLMSAGSYQNLSKQNLNYVSNLPTEYYLSQNFPNPFNPTTQISYSLKNKGFVQLEVYNVLGQKVVELVNSVQNKGIHNVTFNGSHLSSGIYFYKIQSNGFTDVKKMLIIK